MAGKDSPSTIESAAADFIRALRSRIERPVQQAILALERVARLTPGDREIEARCVRELRAAADAVRAINLAGLPDQMFELERNLTRIAKRGNL